MIRRVSALVLLAAAVTGAALIPPPAPRPGPDFDVPIKDIAFQAPPTASVWHCPWVNASAETDAVFLLASATEVDAMMTLPAPVLNEDPATATVLIGGSGSSVVNVGSIVRGGETPGFVEFSDGPAAAATAVWSNDILTADRCVAAVPKIWYLPGGTTREGMSLTVRLFNPFPDDVKVSVTGSSEFGVEPLPEYASVLVSGRSWVNLDLNSVVPLLDDLSLVVTASDGTIIPVMSLSGEDPGADQASWSGTGLSTVWYFANVTQGGLAPTLAVTNPGELDATITIDVLTRGNAFSALVQQVVPAGLPMHIPLDELVLGNFGIRVSSSELIGAAIIAQEPLVEPSLDSDDLIQDGDPRQRLAGTVGADQAATTWLLPGAGGIPETDTSIWIMNPGDASVTVSLEPLGVPGLPVDKVIVESSRVFRYRVPDDIDISSYLVDASSPIVVSLAVQSPRAMAFMMGVPIDG